MDTRTQKIIIVIVLALVGGRPFILSLMDKSVYRGEWYTVTVPEGWEKKEIEEQPPDPAAAAPKPKNQTEERQQAIEKKSSFHFGRRRIEEVLFISPEVDIFTETPYAMFSIYTQASKGALFLDDYFIQVQEAFAREKGRMMDKGEILIDGQVSKWLLFRYEDPPFAVMSFYVVDDFNRLTRLQLIAQRSKFNDYRKQFEAFKSTFKFKRAFK